MTREPDPMRGIEAELIAKVLDGRATSEERARVLAMADESPELLAVLADSAAALDAGAVTEVTPIRRRVPRAALVALAAVVAFVIIMPGVMRSRAETPALPVTFGEVQSLAGAARAGAPPGATRGSGDEERLRQSAVLGARTMDYMVLIAGRDTGATTAAIEIATMLRAIAGGSVAAAQVEAVQSASGDLGPAMPGVVMAIESVVDRQAFRRAAWLELVRLAAAGRDVGTLRRADLVQALEAMARDKATGAEVSALLTAISAEPPVWSEIERLLKIVIPS